jgi:heat shock protein HslJ
VISLQFLGGLIAGFAGCNTYNGGYSALLNPDGTYSVTITGVTTTAMACPEEIMKQESAYLALLPTVVAAQLQGNILNLSYPAGSTYPQGSLVYHQAGTVGP